MRHIDMRSAWLNQLKQRDLIDFGDIKGTENPADVYTKIFSKKAFNEAMQQRMGKLPKFMCCTKEPGDISSRPVNSEDTEESACAEPPVMISKASVCKY